MTILRRGSWLLLLCVTLGLSWLPQQAHAQAEEEEMSNFGGGNVRFPRLYFREPGEYDTAAYENALKMAIETAGLFEGEIDPDTYMLGPNDMVQISVISLQNIDYTTSVSPSGIILVPGVGSISVRGMSLTEAREALKQRVQDIMPDARVAMTLFRIRTFKNVVLGAVRKPATIQSTPVDRVSEVIERAGGIDWNGSLRNIRVHRRGDERLGVPDTILQVDLQRYYQYGDVSRNPTLMDGDIIKVPKLTNRETIEIGGDVFNEDRFEWIDGDSLSTLIRFAGGFQASAQLDSVEVYRHRPRGAKVEYLDLNHWRDQEYDENLPGDVALMPGDKVFVRTTPHWMEEFVVKVRGEVKYQGDYPIRKGDETLMEVLERAGGFTDDASLEGAVIIRMRDLGEKDKELDRLNRTEISDMSEEELTYFRARQREFRGLMAVDFRALFQDSAIENDIILQHQDSIYVPTKKDYINVIGRVNNPGRIIYQPGESFLSYIQKAGGFGFRADGDETLVIKPKGQLFLAEDENYTLEPGDNILVPQEPETKFIDVFKESLAITSQVATVLVAIVSFTR